jgi:flagellar hook-associated protein 1 FlgK
VDVVVDGVTLVSASTVLDRLEAYDPGSGQLAVRSQASATPLTVTGGSIAGTLSVRDSTLTQLRGDIDGLANRLITEVNVIHRAGFSLTGSTGADFFTGTDAATISINGALSGNPSFVQAAGVAGAAGDNQTALALAQLGSRPLAALNQQTLGQRFGQIVAGLGQSLSSANAQIDNQDIVQKMLLRQRDSVGGVSLDEEMTDLLRFQRAYQASARLITTLDEMLEIAVNLKR